MSELTPKMRAFLEERRFAVLGTANTDGSPHLTVMWYLLEGDEIVFNTTPSRLKHRNLRRDPRVSVMVSDGYRYLRIDGSARAIDDRGTGQADIRRLAVRYEGEESAERQMRNAFSKQERVTYRVAIGHVYAGGF
ncbi:MAG: PPOX class F420-dependent oxidoreductase [Chloroflexota bacterium]